VSLSEPKKVTTEEVIVYEQSEKIFNKSKAEKLIKISGLALLLITPLFLVNEYYLQIATLLTFYAVVSLGWNILGGFAAQISLGHAVFFGIGGYTTAILQINYNLSPWVGLLAGVVISIIVAILIGLPVFQLSGHYFALATLALLQIGHILFTYFSDFTGGSVGLYIPILENSLWMFQFDNRIWYYYFGAALLIVCLWVSRRILYSKLGYQLKSIKQNPEAAVLAGVNLLRAKMIALIISATIVSVAGAFYVQFIQFINPDAAFSFDLTIKMALFAIIGGVYSWWGPILGVLILVPIDEFTASFLTGSLAPIAEVVYGLLLIIMVLLKPRGLAEWIETHWKKYWGDDRK
jgi:branched-chain amino acid transport system permease protein